MGIVEAFVCVVGFLIPQFFPIPFAFPSHFCRICNFLSQQPFSLFRDGLKSTQVASCIFFSSLRLSFLPFCLLEVDFLYAEKIYLREGGMDFKDILYQSLGSDGRNFVKDFTRA